MIDYYRIDQRMTVIETRFDLISNLILINLHFLFKNKYMRSILNFNRD